LKRELSHLERETWSSKLQHPSLEPIRLVLRLKTRTDVGWFEERRRAH
jgi:hypothetical protein